MGDIADMMLDGTLCEGCGEFLGEPVGHPRYCPPCGEERGVDDSLIFDKMEDDDA